MTSERHTGLNTYHLKTAGLLWVYSTRPQDCGYDQGRAATWLWQPECLTARIAEVAEQMPWAGQLTAVRARP